MSGHLFLGPLIRQRFARLGADLQHPTDFVKQLLIFDGLPTFQGLDIVCRSVGFLCELGLGHLEPFFAAAPLDGVGHFGVCFLGGDDVVGSVDFGEALAFGAFVCLRKGARKVSGRCGKGGEQV